MSFTEAEKKQWHAERRAGLTSDGEIKKSAAQVCGHCGNPFDNGVVTPDFALCDICNGD